MDPTAGPDQDEVDDAELEEMKRQVAEMEREASEMNALLPPTPTSAAPGKSPLSAHAASSKTFSSPQAVAASSATQGVDENSVHVGNLNDATAIEDLQNHFSACGAIKRITILCDKWSGKPKGYAYVEFDDPSGVELALAFAESTLKGNQITVMQKRQNVPSYMLRGRGRGGGGGFRGRGAFRGRGGGGFRGRYQQY